MELTPFELKHSGIELETQMCMNGTKYSILVKLDCLSQSLFHRVYKRMLTRGLILFLAVRAEVERHPKDTKLGCGYCVCCLQRRSIWTRPLERPPTFNFMGHPDYVFELCAYRRPGIDLNTIIYQ